MERKKERQKRDRDKNGGNQNYWEREGFLLGDFYKDMIIYRARVVFRPRESKRRGAFFSF